MAFSQTYDKTNPGSAVSNREQLLDALTILAPEETPITSACSKIKATSAFVEWTVDSLSAPVTAGVAEGADVTSFTDKFAGRARLGNYVQKFRRDFMVSDLQQAVDSVGPAKVAEAEAKAVREIKRDIEATICSGNDRSVEDGAGAVYGLRGLDRWINTSPGADVPANYRTPSGSIWGSGTFNELALNNLITSMYRVTGAVNSVTLYADTALRRSISDFTRISGSTDYAVRNVNMPDSSTKIHVSVELYQSDHGIVSVVNMNPDCAPDTTNRDTGYLINQDFVQIAELIPLGSSRLPNFGGGERGYVDATLTLVCKHPGAHGKITSLT